MIPRQRGGRIETNSAITALGHRITPISRRRTLEKPLRWQTTPRRARHSSTTRRRDEVSLDESADCYLGHLLRIRPSRCHRVGIQHILKAGRKLIAVVKGMLHPILSQGSMRLIFNPDNAADAPPRRDFRRRRGWLFQADGVDQTGTLARLKAIRAEVVDPTIAKVMAASSTQPVTACLRISQRGGCITLRSEMRRRWLSNVVRAIESRIEYRIAFIRGYVAQGDNLMGDNVNIALA